MHADNCRCSVALAVAFASAEERGFNSTDSVQEQDTLVNTHICRRTKTPEKKSKTY
jgi:hypothetical protein